MLSPAERAGMLSTGPTVELPEYGVDFMPKIRRRLQRRTLLQSILFYITCNWK